MAAHAFSLSGGEAQRLDTPQARVGLLVHAPDGVVPGSSFWAGLHIEHAPDWHTYWKNPGDSGLPTRMEWRLPTGWTVSDIHWPTPKRFPLGDLANYGYDGDLLLPVRIHIPADWTVATERLHAEAHWLICRVECLPQQGRFVVDVRPGQTLASRPDLFEAALQAQPTEASGKVKASAEAGNGRLALRVAGLPRPWQGQPVQAFPEDAGLIRNGADWTQEWKDGEWIASVPLDAMRTAAPERTRWVLAPQRPTATVAVPTPAGIRLDAPVAGGWPPATAPVPAPLPAALVQALQAPPATTAPPPPAATTAWGALGLLGAALLGGLLLNLMPCVFPVLAIKGLALSQPPAQPGRRWSSPAWQGWAYTAGVVSSFVALGSLWLALRAAGHQLGWGFQLQSPAVVAALAGLFTLIGLNLAGWFEWRQWMPQRLVNLRAEHPAVDAWLTGVLTTVVASPCTAPFMAAALGAALVLPTALALAVFVSLGFGLALPYLLLGLWAPLRRKLPRPGPWMDGVRRALAFPMLGTVIWLVWVLGQQSGMDGVAALLAALLGLAAVAWSWTATGRWHTPVALGVSLVWAAGVVLAWPVITASPTGAVTSASVTRGDTASPWRPWQPGATEAASQQGKTVLVDFTAAWCITCQFNKATSLADPRLLALAASGEVVLLRADWTRRDPDITQALSALGRSGVPTYAVYRSGQPVRLLSEMPSGDEVWQAVQPTGMGASGSAPGG